MLSGFDPKGTGELSGLINRTIRGTLIGLMGDISTFIQAVIDSKCPLLSKPREFLLQKRKCLADYGCDGVLTAL